ncbi:dihydroorotate dehydrogenase-like protein [Stieleria sp. ICT_E10.1]|uniref:dihydroorotate dehydrogenase-like protein n=1 Tax=Stieleria sedimenti TaxID=2976331 RepID=UPI0021806B58|nr:dihydroorotate dehydrogenase-like protein [Stieleria sedimenti]MCS7465677.1 dihydroorotate dehydrogenase-like protein [Stieleria sedimenti]
MTNIDLSTSYLGLELKNPFIASASPLTGSVESLLHLERAGAAAVVLPSLFEEQIEHEREQFEQLNAFQSDSMAESLSFFPDLERYNTGPEEYLQLIRDAKESLCIPVIASLNGFSSGGWKYYGELMEQAGADALELNIYLVPTDPRVSASDVERHYRELVLTVREQLRIPLAVKMGPFFSSPATFGCDLVESGAAGLVLFNRFLSPEIDLESLEFVPALQLSQPEELRLALRWIAILRDRIQASIAATGGVHSGLDTAKALLVGADAVMIASTLLKHGIDHLQVLRNELVQWMDQNGYFAVEQLKGSMSMDNCSNPDGLKRANYMKALTSYTTKV